jgi:hypothetical protein
MKKALLIFPLLLSLVCFSQLSTKLPISEGAYQFNNQINSIIKEAIHQNIRKIEFSIIGKEYNYESNELKSISDTLKIYSWNEKVVCEILKNDIVLISAQRTLEKSKMTKGSSYKYSEGLYSLVGKFEKKSNSKKIIFKKNKTPNSSKIYKYKSKDTLITKVYQFDTTSTMHGKFNKGFHIEKSIDSNLVQKFYFDENYTVSKSQQNIFWQFRIPHTHFRYINDNSITDLYIYKNYQTKTNTSFSKKWVSKNKYIQTKIEKTRESSAEKDIVKKIKYEYIVNKKKLPISIKIIENILDGYYLATGSTLTIKYWK